jgi:hypothetical protein
MYLPNLHLLLPLPLPYLKQAGASLPAAMTDVLMVCVGSRGDVQPFVMLAQALQQQGG